ncbi:MAG: hypothetical protein R3E68_18385 [Burkholderiaceae bacterium]
MQLLVVHDELDMMPGQARLKLGGGVAGHNGSRTSARVAARPISGGCAWASAVRGVNSGLRQPVVDYVLRPPSNDDLGLIDRGIGAALAAVPDLVRGEFEAGMLKLHTAVGKPGRSGKDD